MLHRASCIKLLAPSLAIAVLVLGAAVPAAFAKKPNPPNNTQLPNGRPFQLIQGMIDGLEDSVDALADRVDALQATAPTAGTMWINPLDLSTTLGTVTLAPAPAATPGLVVSGAVADTLQAGLQVPLGFAVAGVTVCYTAGAGSVSSLALTKVNPAPPFTASPLAAVGALAGGCTTSAVDPSYDPSNATAGGPAYLAIGVSGGLTIHGIALQLVPVVAAP